MNGRDAWFVYILECANGALYTGYTGDVGRRFEAHRGGPSGAKFTRSFRPVRVARCWRVEGSRGDAMRVERLIKAMDRDGKIGIVERPEMLDEMARRALERPCRVSPHDPVLPERVIDIIGYRSTPRDRKLWNPYLDEVLSLIASVRRRGRTAVESVLAERRSELTARYAFSIPTAAIIDAVAARSPLVEIGAGSGYWARCLAGAGADIIAYDQRPPGEEAPWDGASANRWFDDTWFHVMEGDETMAARYPERALFLCWPPIHEPMAAAALRGYREAGGETLVYIGDPGATGDDEFRDALADLPVIRSERIRSWPAIEEWMIICRTGQGHNYAAGGKG